MSFISYAQNFEDVMLWRALKHVERGFYIDVGANDPQIDSVTKAFYDQGWRGINIEPVAQWFKKLEETRSRDINLQLAAGAEAGEMLLYELPDTGLSTTDKSFAERHETERGYVKNERLVPVKTLTEICRQYHEAPIHFLKIDVEGAEKQVLSGLDLEKIRPWIIVVESTLPLTQIEDYEQWEPILLGGGYEFVYFDGLNRFYVASEHGQLKSSFRSPPNLFDDFIRAQQLNSELRAQEAETKVQQFQGKVQQFEARAQEAETRVQEADAKAHQAETRAQEAETRAQGAEAKVQEAETKAQQFQAKVQEAEAKARQAETRVQEADAKAQQFEARAQEAETRVQEAEVKVQEAETKAQQFQAKVQEAEAKAQQAETRVQEADAKAQQFEAKAQEAETKFQEAETRAQQAESYINAIYASRSWRITAPLRWFGFQARLLRQYGLPARIKALAKKIANPIVRRSIAFVSTRPRLRHRGVNLAKRLGLYESLRSIYLRFSGQHHPVTSHGIAKRAFIPSETGEQLSPRAQKIYADLKTAIENNKEAR